MEHIISGCTNCPLFNDGNNFEYNAICHHPAAPHQFYEPGITKDQQKIPTIEIEESDKYLFQEFKRFPTTPNWCPLSKEPITITKK